jgi:hypothetical protein
MNKVLILLDETYPREAHAEVLAVAAVAAPEGEWDGYARELSAMASTRGGRSKRICEFVAARAIRAAIAGLRLDLIGAIPGSRDEYTDVGDLSARDRAWVDMAGQATNIVALRVLEAGWAANSFYIYYDPKSLAREHRSLTATSLPQVLAREATDFVRRTRGSSSQAIVVPLPREVQKPRKDHATPLTWGTWLAHEVAKLPHNFFGDALPPNIEVYKRPSLRPHLAQVS